MMFIFVILIIVLVYYSMNQNNSGVFQSKARNPEELLKERFVKGEIDESSYLQMKEILKR